MFADIRLALRQLLRRPALALTCIVVLGLGLGVATAMFSVLDAVLLRPLPYTQPSQLVTVQEPRGPEPIFWGVSHPDAQDWLRSNRSFTSLAFYQVGEHTLQTSSDSVQLNSYAVAGNLFATLGVSPSLGRRLDAADVTHHANVAVISHHTWQADLNADPGVIGRTIRLDGVDTTVVGVMPAGFIFPFSDPGDVFTPYVAPTPDDRTDADGGVIARLRPGVSPTAAQADVSALQAAIARENASLHLTDHAVVRRYADTLVGSVRPALWSATLAIGLIWLIACAAVAGLMLSRFAARRRELAVRAALGASRRQLARQLLAESLWIGLGSALAGWGIAAMCIAALRPFLVRRVSFTAHYQINAAALLGLLSITILSVLVVGLAPALGAAAVPAQPALQDRSATANRGQRRLRDSLVVVEVALALVLLSGAGLLLRTVYALSQVPLGFTTTNIITARLSIPRFRFDHASISQSFEAPLLARLDALPGVRAAAVSSVIPLARGVMVKGMFGIVGRPNLRPDQQPQGDMRFTSPDYARTLGIPVERGRFFDAALDTPASPRVIVINHALAARYFPGQNPVGQQLSLGKNGAATIIGVLADTRNTAVAAPPAPEMHFATSQLTPGSPFYGIAAQFVQLAVRTQGSPALLIPAIRSTLHQAAPEIAPGDFLTMQQLRTASMGDQIFFARLLGLFAVSALLVAIAGLYGLLAYGVAQRTREIGVRMALGAESAQVLRLILGRAGRLLALGVALGLAAALALAQLLRAYLYGVPARDPATLAAAAALLIAAGLMAAWLPARRAARISPLEALRAE